MLLPQTLTELSHSNLFVGLQPAERVTFIDSFGVSSFDIVWLDAAVNGGIKDIRQFVSDMLLGPQFGEVRLGVIDGAESLTVEAQNALLKLLEEPAESVVLILLAQTESRILPTVISRCRLFRTADQAHKTTKQPTQDQLSEFLAAENLAKDEALKTTIEARLHEVFEEWVGAGRPHKSVDQVEKIADLYHNLDTQINKRLLLEQYALERYE